MNISPKAKETTDRLNNFMDKHVYPNNETYQILKRKQKKKTFGIYFYLKVTMGMALQTQSMRQCVKSWGEQCGLRKFSIVLLLIPVIWKF